MTLREATRSSKVRSKLKHPVVDADGHWVEMLPVLMDYVKQEAGTSAVKRYIKELDPATNPLVTHQQYQEYAAMTAAERKDGWVSMRNWWAQPVDTLERATVGLPKLLAERLDDFGVDFCILYPSRLTMGGNSSDAALHRVLDRAYNRYVMDVTREFADRMTPVAMIYLDDPDDVVADLRHAVRDLGFKAVVFHTRARRAVPKIAKEHPKVAAAAARTELFGMDSDYDYDKVWQACLDLKVAATFHSGIGGQAGSSTSSYVYNHVATLSLGHAHLAKALFMGGVTRRFPELRFGFLEGGVGWGISLLADLHGHWEKRGWKHIESLDPAKLDTEHFLGLVEEYGDAKAKAKLGEIAELFARPLPHPEQLDDFAQAGVKRREDFKDRFVESFYFGCEADDPVNALAFDRKLSPVGETLKICYGTDIGHWDVPVCNDVLHEARELVEHGLLTEAQFKQFVYSNAVQLHTHTNRDFFKGTRVEREVAKMLKAGTP